jgi:hypothetical protein
MPVYFGPSESVPCPSIIIEVTPDEFERIKSKRLGLPSGWKIAYEIPRPVEPIGAK